MTTRRAFLQSTALAAPALFGDLAALPRPQRPKPSNRINIAMVGCGYQATYGNLNSFLIDPRVQITMACDPILRAPGYGYKAEAKAGRAVLKAKVDAFYGNHDCRMEQDWRKVVDDPTIDAVVVMTPDHWHAAIGIAAMRKGKHVYGQKPLALGISEGQAMVRVARETGVVFQTGSQQRSASEFRVACEIVRNGYLGELKGCEVKVETKRGGCWGHTFNRERRKPPAYFESGMWNLWQGPARLWEDNAFIPGIHEPMVWRFNSRTGNGMLADWGAHHFDILQWALGKDDSGPVAIENMTTNLPEDDEVFDFADVFDFDFVYENGFRCHVSNGHMDDPVFKFHNGVLFHGTEGDLLVRRGFIKLPPKLKKWREKKDLKDSDIHLHKSRGPHESDFIDGICLGTPVAAPCAVGHRSATLCHLANICEHLRIKGLKWDPVAERVIGNDAAQKLTVVPHHNGWTFG